MISDKEMFDIAMVIVDLRIEYIQGLPEWKQFQDDCPHLAQKVKNAVEAMKALNQENQMTKLELIDVSGILKWMK